jgi:opacity protein-like surface antigen
VPKRRRGTRWGALAGLCALLLSALPAGAPRAEGDWQFTLTPYLWLAFIDIEAETSQGTFDTSAGFEDVFTDLNFAFMLSGEAHNGTWGVLIDLLYLDVTTEGDTPRGILYDRAVVDTSGFVGSIYGEYRVLHRQGLSLDLLAGLRFYSVSVDASLKGGALPKVTDDASDTWVDPVIGLRSRLKLGEDWFLGVSGDVGGFGAGSKLTWQVLGTVGWQFAEDWTLQAGYRYFVVDKDFDGQEIDFTLHGPIVGVSYRF